MILDEVLDSLAEKGKTLNWDVVVAYDRISINSILEQQYIRKVSEGTHFYPVSFSTSDGTIHFGNLKFSAPRISFENSNTLDSRINVKLDLISGSIIESTTQGRPVKYSRIRPGMGYHLSMEAMLSEALGDVNEDGKIVVNFNEASVKNINVLSCAPDEVINFFQMWLNNNPVSYEIGGLSKQNLGSEFTPKKFIIRTQQKPESKQGRPTKLGDGAILLFVSTNFNPAGGLLPTNSYPWIIPDDFSSAILIDNKIIINNYIKPALDNILDAGCWEMSRTSQVSDSAWFLKASDDTSMITGFLRATDSHGDSKSWTGDYGHKMFHGYYEIHEDFIYSFKNAVMKPCVQGYVLHFDSSNEFERLYGAFYSHTGGNIVGQYQLRKYVKHSVSGYVQYTTEVDSENEVISIKLGENRSSVNSNYEQAFENSSSMAPVLAPKFSEMLNEQMRISDQLLERISFKDVSIFCINHLLFPECNVNRMLKAYTPGDMLILGEIKPASTELSLTPLETCLPAGGTLQFKTNTTEEVIYSLPLADTGDINSDGLYIAPKHINGSLVNVRVIASTLSGKTSLAHITIVPSTVLISPSFCVLEEDEISELPINTISLDYDKDITWEIEGSDSEFLGKMIGNTYIPEMKNEYPRGYTFVTATATSKSGGKGSVIIMVASKETIHEFSLSPSYVTHLLPNEKITITSKSNIDFEPDFWSLYPACGGLSELEIDNNTYTINYISDSNVKGGQLVVVTTNDSKRKHRAGYTIIDNANFTN